MLTERAVVIVEPTTNQPPVTPHPFFSLKQTELTCGHMNRIKADMPERTVRDIMGKYFRTDTERALQLLRRPEQDNMAAKHVFCLTASNKVMEDLRVYLHDEGKLDRPSFWQNPYRQVRMAEKRARQVDQLDLSEAQLQIKHAGAEQLRDQANMMESEAERRAAQIEKAREAVASERWERENQPTVEQMDVFEREQLGVVESEDIKELFNQIEERTVWLVQSESSLWTSQNFRAMFQELGFGNSEKTALNSFTSPKLTLGHRFFFHFSVPAQDVDTVVLSVLTIPVWEC